MLTRIEIDGFKSFENFSLDLGPLTVIAGANASGKSNLFDAIQLMSKLASFDLLSAVKSIRGEPHELFRRSEDGKVSDRIKLAAEVLINPQVRDPWGEERDLKHTRIRYEISIERRKIKKGSERLVVAEEKAFPILLKKDHWATSLYKPSKNFRETYLKYSRKEPWLSTDLSADPPTFAIRQDGNAGRKRPAEAAEATVLSSIASIEFQHLFALREEMRSWRLLHLDPAALRKSSPMEAPEILEPNGSNLATVLSVLQAETRTADAPRGVISEIEADLAAIIPGTLGIKLSEDTDNRKYQLHLEMREGPPFSSRVVSDGTLRVLALLAILHDPYHYGVTCFEEPENGIHPLRLKLLLSRLRELVTQPGENDISPEAPLYQIIMNTHSPVTMSALHDHEMLFADLVAVIDPERRSINRKTRIRPVKTLQELFKTHEYVTPFEVENYLSAAQREE